MTRVLLLAAVVLSFFAALRRGAFARRGRYRRPPLPQLGNGGYDVQHYDLDLRYATRRRRRGSTARSHPGQGHAVAVTLRPRLRRTSVGGVSVNGLPAKFARDGEDLVITPKLPLPRARRSSSGARTTSPRRPCRTPTTSRPPRSSSARRLGDPPQPNGAHVFLPSNDHPRDKATFTSASTCPPGRPRSPTASRSPDDRPRAHALRLLQRQPMATELSSSRSASTR